MGVAAENIDLSRPISNYGVDSLMAVEIRSWLFTKAQADVSVFELLSNISISSLIKKVVSRSKCVPRVVLLSEG